MTRTVPNPQDLQGQVLYDSRGEEIGLIEGVYLDNETRTPEWAAVRLGPKALALVPLADASPARGARVDYDLGTMLEAPFQLTALDNEVNEETEQLLYRYYEGDGDASSPARSVVLVVVATAEVVVGPEVAVVPLVELLPAAPHPAMTARAMTGPRSRPHQ